MHNTWWSTLRFLFLAFLAFRLTVHKVERGVENQRCLFIKVVNLNSYRKRDNDVSFWTSMGDTKNVVNNWQRVCELFWEECCNRLSIRMELKLTGTWKPSIASTDHWYNCSKFNFVSTVTSALLTDKYLPNLVTVLASKPRCTRSRMAPSTSGVTRLLTGPTSTTSLLWMEELQNEATGYRWP